MRQLGIAPGDKAVAAFIQENLKDPQTGQSQYENVIQAVEAAGSPRATTSTMSATRSGSTRWPAC